MNVFYTVSERYANRAGDPESDCLLFTDDHDEAVASAAGHEPRRLGGHIVVVRWENRDGGWDGREIQAEETNR
jgi:hypothetical protein